MQWNAYQRYDFDSVFANSQKYSLSVHQIATSGEKFNIFVARVRTKTSLGIRQNTLF